jgi:hypothetical protein
MISSRRKILAFAACRSDYGLVSALLKKPQLGPRFDFSLLVSGVHASPEHRETARMIEEDEQPIFARIQESDRWNADLVQRLSPEGVLENVINHSIVHLRRQDLPVAYHPNGASYANRPELLIQDLTFYPTATRLRHACLAPHRHRYSIGC